MTTCKVFFHDACFDGTASAALFSAFYRTHVPGAALVPIGVHHRLGDAFAAVAIDGDDNACVDFRYSPHPAMRWWFDHHATAFQPTELRAHFEGRADEHMAFDPTAPSCAGVVTRVLAERYGWTPPPHLVELTAWADIVDAAAYPDARTATALATPATRLAVWVASVRDPALVRRYIATLELEPLEAIDRAPWVRAGLEPILARRAADRDRWLAMGDVRGPVVMFDLIGRGVGSPGLTAYDLFPSCTYTVAVMATDGAVKVGVGWNPWGGPRRHDLGELCAAHGGGGHPVVGGVTLPAGEIAHGRAVAATLVAALTADPVTDP
ncbi:MAG: phosphoesterase [Myxococcales bacterium]|nr:phosphoesterase [Myxococcales bacterium]